MTISTISQADITEILKHIPHRYPFLLIDRMEACEPGLWVRVVKNISANDRVFDGVPHVQRVMPQMLILEALAQAAGILCHFSGLMRDLERAVILFASASNCRFGRDAHVGDQLVFECRLRRAMRGVAKLSGTCTIDSKFVLETDLSAVIRDFGASRRRA